MLAVTESKKILARFYHERVGESYVNLDAYLNEQGSITIYIKDEVSIDISPLAAKELMIRINKASKDFAAELLSSK